VIRAAGGAYARAPAFAAAVLALLVAAGVFALFRDQELKREPPLLKKPHGNIVFQPSGTGHPLRREAHFDVRATLGDVLEVTVVTPAGRAVDVIASLLRVREYRSVHLDWNGRTTAGVPAPPGLYDLRVHFEHGGQTTIVPGFSMLLKGPPP